MLLNLRSVYGFTSTRAMNLIGGCEMVSDIIATTNLETAVSAQLIDPSGIIWRNARIHIKFISAPGRPSSWEGGNIPRNIILQADNLGNFSVTLPDNMSIDPLGSQWEFSIAPDSTQPAIIFRQIIASSSMDLTAIFTSIAASQHIPLVQSTPLPRAYADIEVAEPPNSGQLYFNTSYDQVKAWYNNQWNIVEGGGGGNGSFMEWPPAGVAVSSGSSWAASINPGDLPRLGAVNTFTATNNYFSGTQTMGTLRINAGNAQGVSPNIGLFDFILNPSTLRIFSAGPNLQTLGGMGFYGANQGATDIINYLTMTPSGATFGVPVTIPAGSSIAGYLPLSGGTLNSQARINFGDIYNYITNTTGNPRTLISISYGFTVQHWTGFAYFGIDWASNGYAWFNVPVSLLAGDPTQPLQAATKQYVDAFGNQLGNYLPLSGGTLTGPLTMGANVIYTDTMNFIRKQSPISANLELAVNYGLTIRYSQGNDIISINWASGSGNNTIYNTTFFGPLLLAADPTQPLQAATKQYVDSVAAGGGSGAYLPLTGGTLSGPLTVNSSFSSGMRTVASPLDVTQHWTLYEDTTANPAIRYGISMSAGQMNLVAATNQTVMNQTGSVAFYTGTTLMAAFGNYLNGVSQGSIAARFQVPVSAPTINVTGAGALAVTGGVPATPVANTTYIDNYQSSGRLISVGPNSATQGNISIIGAVSGTWNNLIGYLACTPASVTFGVGTIAPAMAVSSGTPTGAYATASWGYLDYVNYSFRIMSRGINVSTPGGVQIVGMSSNWSVFATYFDCQPSVITAGLPITLPSDPIIPLHAVTKQYVDGQITALSMNDVARLSTNNYFAGENTFGGGWALTCYGGFYFGPFNGMKMLGSSMQFQTNTGGYFTFIPDWSTQGLILDKYLANFGVPVGAIGTTRIQDLQPGYGYYEGQRLVSVSQDNTSLQGWTISVATPDNSQFQNLITFYGWGIKSNTAIESSIQNYMIPDNGVVDFNTLLGSPQLYGASVPTTTVYSFVAASYANGPQPPAGINNWGGCLEVITVGVGMMMQRATFISDPQPGRFWTRFRYDNGSFSAWYGHVGA